MIIVGFLMIEQLKEVNLDNIDIASSVFMTIIMMVLGYSISLGIAWGFLTYAVATVAMGKYREMSWGMWILTIVFIIYLFFGL